MVYSPAGIAVRKADKKGVRNIFFDGKQIGRVSMVEKCGDYEAHWSGSVVDPDNENWMVSEENLGDVRKRVKEAYQ